MQLVDKIKRLNEIGVALSAEGDQQALLEKILLGARELTGSDGGTLYIVTPEKTLRFAIVINASLGIRQLGVGLGVIPLYDHEGKPNLNNVAAAAVLQDCTINLPDAYKDEGYDFSGTREFDNRNGYVSKSFLTVPLKDHQGKIVGALQLINALDEAGEIRAFVDSDVEIVESLASQAAVAITKQGLLDKLNSMLEGFIQAIGRAIDEKSPHTGNHCRRVPILTMMIAKAMGKFSQQELNELHIAALLHDCGKITTPIHVMDKATRLQTLVDRIEVVELKFEIARRDLEIATLRGEITEKEKEAKLKELNDGLVFLHQCNHPLEIIGPDKAAKIRELAKFEWKPQHKDAESVLNEQDFKNLMISHGTLNDEEKKVVQQHVMSSIEILENLTYPDHLVNVPKIAGAHHERIDGKGYPFGLKGEEMLPQARILAFADIFEALTSPDRPYRKAFTLSETLNILNGLKTEGHIDPEIFNVFMGKKLYLDYAKDYITPEQFDLAEAPA